MTLLESEKKLIFNDNKARYDNDKNIEWGEGFNMPRETRDEWIYHLLVSKSPRTLHDPNNLLQTVKNKDEWSKLPESEKKQLFNDNLEQCWF
jgi:hypothetical protein